VNVGAIQNGSLGHEHYSSSPSKTLRAEMGFSFRAAGCVKRVETCWTERQTTNAAMSPHCASTTKEKPAGVKPATSSPLLVRMHPGERDGLPLFRQSNHVHRPCVTPFCKGARWGKRKQSNAPKYRLLERYVAVNVSDEK
jgi:hypothetical protein